MKKISLVIYSISFLLLNISANAEICLDPQLESQPILAAGRVTPLFVHASHSIKFMFDKNNCKELSSTALYCFLSQGRRSEIEKKYACELKLTVSHIANKEFLGLQKNENGISPELAWGKKDQLLKQYELITQNGDKSSSIPTDIAKLIERLRRLTEIEEGKNWKIITGVGNWVTHESLVSNPNAESLIFSGTTFLTDSEYSSIKYETLYEKTKPFSVGILIAFLGFLFSILSVQKEKFKSLAIAAFILLLVDEIFGMTLRVLISGRAPVTNMYETVMWSGFCLFMLAGAVGFYLKNRKVWALGFFGNALCLLMMNFASSMLDASIQPLVPVLRDNFWLSTHVTSITLSYSCFALSWLISNYVLLNWILIKSTTPKWLEDWNYVNRIAMQIGSVFLALGVILGGVWADYSWGRFWGWDPKETWSLVALIIYMAILHGRYVGWFKGIYFTMMGGLGFLFVLMAWFGVNFILATGLHNYGFSTGGAFFLAIIFTAQILLLITAYVKSKMNTRILG